MPPIRSQAILADGLEIQTQHFGLVRVQVTTIGNTTTATVFTDGVQRGQAVFHNPNVGELEARVNEFLAAETSGFNRAVHIFSVDPWSATMISSDGPIPAEWWL